MGNFAASDVTYTINKVSRDGSSIVKVQATLAFGDGVLTYAAGGIPLTKGKLGCPNVIYSFNVFGNAAASVGYGFQYDKASEKLLIVQGIGQSAHTHTVAHAHDLLVKGGQIGSTTNDIAHYATDILGKEAATDATILGSASATKGGVISATPTTSSSGAFSAGGLAEVTGVAIVAQLIDVEVLGW
jgi:hypothetical protein